MIAQLQHVPTDTLRRELMARERCHQCGTRWSDRWVHAGVVNRVVCGDCDAVRKLATRRRRRSKVR